MGTVNVTLGDGKKLNLILGQQLENAVTAVVFDFSAWQTEFGSGTLGLSVQRHGDTQPYAVVPTVSGTNATWNITELDTAYKGVGEVQVTYTVGSVVKKSTVYKFTVYRSLGENGEYPSPGQTWQEEIEDELADVKQDLGYGFDSLGLLDINSDKWETGGIYSATGANNPYWPNYLRTKDYISVTTGEKILFISDTAQVKADLYTYNDNGFVAYGVNLSNGGIYTIPSNVTKIRFVLYHETQAITKFDLLEHVIICSDNAQDIYDFFFNNSSVIGAQATISSNILVSSSNASSYPDVNLFPNRTIINVLSSANIANKPFSSCTVITTGFSITTTTPYGGSKQIAIDNNTGAIATRSHDGTNWSDWNNVYTYVDSRFTKATNILVNSSNASSYPNVGTFPNRSIINVLGSANIIGKPFSSCVIITTGYNTTSSAPYGGSKQLAFDNNSGSMASRSYDGTNWSEWTYSDHIFKADNTNFIEIIEKALSVTNATVILASGTYNLFDSTHDETYWKNKRPATRYCGINLKNGIKVVGDGIVNLDANYTGSDEDIKENFSVFNIAGSCEIRNINIDASNICYLIHDDPRIVSNENNSCVVHGCKLMHNGTDHTFTSGAPMCIGAGESNNSYREYTDNVLDSTYDRSANVHTATNGKGKYIITGNYFIKGTLGFTAFGDGSGRIEGIVSNNSLPVNSVNNSSGASTPYTFNNVIRG